MYKYAAFLMLIVSCNVPADPVEKTDCAKLRNDSFFYFSELSDRTYNIHRNDSIQSETDNATGDIFRLKIVWTDSCEYEMYPVDEIVTDSLNQDSIARLNVIRFRVVKQTADYYIFEASKDNFVRKIADTLFFNRK